MDTPTKKRVLVVDDEKGFTDFIREALERTGRYEVRAENTGGSTLGAVRTFHPDLIFLDILLPDVEGSKVASDIRAEAGLRHVPIVFLTAIVTKEEQAAESGGLIGGFPFLAKPVTIEELVRCVEKYVR